MEVLSYMPVDKHYTHFQPAIYIANEIHIYINNYSCYIDSFMQIYMWFSTGIYVHISFLAGIYIRVRMDHLKEGTLIDCCRKPHVDLQKAIYIAEQIHMYK